MWLKTEEGLLVNLDKIRGLAPKTISEDKIALIAIEEQTLVTADKKETILRILKDIEEGIRKSTSLLDLAMLKTQAENRKGT